MDNHVVLIGSGDLKADAFEEYLSWLLSERSNVLDGDISLTLQNYESSNKQEHVKFLEVVSTAYLAEGKPEGTYFLVGDAVAMLQSLLPTDAVSLDKLGRDSLITAKIRLTVQKRPKTDDFDLLDDIADSFRTLSEKEIGYTMETKAGAIISNIKDERLSKTVSLPLSYDDLPRPDSVWEAMYSWLDKIAKEE
jgi:hypothetical protein